MDRVRRGGQVRAQRVCLIIVSLSLALAVGVPGAPSLRPAAAKVEATPLPTLLPPPEPAPPTRLDLKSFAHMLVDHPNERVFVSGGRGESVVYIVGFDGVIQHIFENEPGAAGMAIHRDRLYVLLRERNAIDVISLSTLKRVRRISLPARVSQYPGASWESSGGLVKADNKLWFSLGRCHGTTEKTTTLNLRTMKLRRHVLKDVWPYHFCPVTFSPFGPDGHLLLAWQPSGYGDHAIVEFDLSGRRPRWINEWVYWGHGTMTDVAVSPDESLLYTTNTFRAEGDAYVLEVLNRSNGSFEEPYPSGPWPMSVSLTAGGSTILVGVLHVDEADELQVYAAGNRSGPISTYALPGDDVDLQPGAVAISRDGTRAVAVARRGEVFEDDRHLLFYSIPLASQP